MGMSCSFPEIFWQKQLYSSEIGRPGKQTEIVKADSKPLKNIDIAINEIDENY